MVSVTNLDIKFYNKVITIIHIVIFTFIYIRKLHKLITSTSLSFLSRCFISTSRLFLNVTFSLHTTSNFSLSISYISCPHWPEIVEALLLRQQFSAVYLWSDFRSLFLFLCSSYDLRLHNKHPSGIKYKKLVHKLNTIFQTLSSL